MEEYQVVIIGAGPAGSSLACLLKKKNIKTLLIDKALFPRKKLCAGGLTPKAFKLYERIFGEGSFTVEDSSNIMKLYFFNEFIMEMKLSEPLRFVDREVFDNELLLAYKSIGGEFRGGSSVKQFDKENSRLTLSDGTEVSYSVLVGADGAFSCVRKLIDKSYSPDAFCVEVFPENKNDDHSVYMYLGEGGGYGWVFPHKDRLGVGYGGSARMASKNVRDFDKFVSLTGVDCKDEKKMGAFIPTFPVNRPASGNILLIGDAGGFVFPTSGEGLYYAAFSAEKAYETALAILSGEISAEDSEKDFKSRLSSIYEIADQVIKLTGRTPSSEQGGEQKEKSGRFKTFKRRSKRKLMAWLQNRKLLRKLFFNYCRKRPELVEYAFVEMTDGNCFDPFKIRRDFKKKKREEKKKAKQNRK